MTFEPANSLRDVELAEHEERDLALLVQLSRLVTPESGKDHFAYTVPFWATLGFFHSTWAAVDQITDFAIGSFLEVSAEQTHLITSGMMFGRKARLLADLMGRSDHPRRQDLLTAFNKLRGDAKRDVFAHSYHVADDEKNLFVLIERSGGGPYKAKRHQFTNREFTAHVQALWNNFHDFASALGATNEDLERFTAAAFESS